jgi:hypothetical protein
VRRSISTTLQALAEVGAGAEEQRAYAGFAAAEDCANLHRAEFVHGREEQGLALLLRQSLHGAEHLLNLSRFGERLVGGEIGGDQGGGEKVVHLIGPGAAGAVEREVPGNADQPGTEVEDRGQFVLPLEDPNEGVLDDILRLGRVVQDGERDAVEQGESSRARGRSDRAQL